VATTTEETGTASNPDHPPRTGGPNHGAAGALVAKLFDEHGRMVLGLCRLLLRDPVEAEDAAQQVFLSAHASIRRGAVPRNAARWLAAIARNECRTRIHARMREPLELPELPSDLPDPLAAAIRATDLEAVWAAISSLPRHQRRALVLRELGGLSYHELGRALGVSHSAVESLLFRARQHVRRLVAAATPLAFRDELERLIPGFDPGTASIAARVASVPVALKLATAAMSVGVITTGAAKFPEHHERHGALTPPVAQARDPAVHRTHVAAAELALVVPQAADLDRRHRHRGREHRGHDERGQRHEAEAEREGPEVEQEHPDVEQREVAQEVEQRVEQQVEEHQSGGPDGDSSGPGSASTDSGSGGDSSGHSDGDSHSGAGH
jgi:RNA polymerase sigma-70 factor, ECF subfamily